MNKYREYKTLPQSKNCDVRANGGPCVYLYIEVCLQNYNRVCFTIFMHGGVAIEGIGKKMIKLVLKINTRVKTDQMDLSWNLGRENFQMMSNL